MIKATLKVLRKWAFDPDPLKALVEELNKIKYGEVAVNPASIAAGAEGDTVVALPAGTAAAGNVLLMQPPATLEAGLYLRRAWVSATDQITLTLRNETAGAIDGANLTWTYVLMSHREITT